MMIRVVHFGFFGLVDAPCGGECREFGLECHRLATACSTRTQWSKAAGLWVSHTNYSHS